MEFETILFEKKDGVARLTLNRPPLNVLNIAMMKEINQALESIQNDTSLKVLVITGTGKAFSGGVDVGDHIGDKVNEMIEVFHRMFRLLNALPQPTLAILNGAALGGGCELAVFCDMVISVETAKIGQPEIQVGVFAPIASIVFPKLLSMKKALELQLTGDTIDAQEAVRIGLINQAVPADKLDEAANTLIQKLAGLSSTVLSYTKKSTYLGLESDFEDVLKKVEHVYLKELMVTKDAEEGLQAFLEKRKPVWQNK
jgi:cyclohexa-1,5-dienecarbonyl-CoA hydratase